MKLDISNCIEDYYLRDAIGDELGLINQNIRDINLYIKNLKGRRKELFDKLDGPEHSGLIFSDDTTLGNLYRDLQHYEAMIDLFPNECFPKVRLYKAHFKNLKSHIAKKLSEGLEDQKFWLFSYKTTPVIDIELKGINIDFPFYIGDINVRDFCNDPSIVEKLGAEVNELSKKAYEMEMLVRTPLRKLSSFDKEIKVEYFANYKHWQNNLIKYDPLWKDSIFFIKLKKESSSSHQVEYLFFDVTDFKKLGDTLKTLRAIPDEETLKELFPHQSISHDKLIVLQKRSLSV